MCCGREVVDDHDRDKRFDRRAVRTIERIGGIEWGKGGDLSVTCVTWFFGVVVLGRVFALDRTSLLDLAIL